MCKLGETLPIASVAGPFNEQSCNTMNAKQFDRIVAQDNNIEGWSDDRSVGARWYPKRVVFKFGFNSWGLGRMYLHNLLGSSDDFFFIFLFFRSLQLRVRIC